MVLPEVNRGSSLSGFTRSPTDMVIQFSPQKMSPDMVAFQRNHVRFHFHCVEERQYISSQDINVLKLAITIITPGISPTPSDASLVST